MLADPLHYSYKPSSYSSHLLAGTKPAPLEGRDQHATPRADPTHYRTSSQMISSVVGALPTGSEHHTYGVPTIRCDRPAPRIRRVGDSTVSEAAMHTHYTSHQPSHLSQLLSVCHNCFSYAPCTYIHTERLGLATRTIYITGHIICLHAVQYTYVRMYSFSVYEWLRCIALHCTLQ